MKVCKFGGSSLANAEQIKKVCDIILSDPSRQVIVVSAPGKSKRSEMKVTDLLIALAGAKLNDFTGQHEMRMVLKRFKDIVTQLELPDRVYTSIESLIQDAAEQTHLPRDEYLDTVKSAGERCSAKLLSAYLNKLEFDAVYVEPKEAGLYLTEEFGNADVLDESYQHLASLKNRPEIVVFPGFYGYTKGGKIVTFSRGGSDITGAILANAIDAECYENWTDVDSVYSVNPELVNDPHMIRELSYREMRELAYSGAGVIHPEAMMPLLDKGIPIYILNTDNPDAAGTKIVRERTNFDGVVTGIAGSKHFCSLNIGEYLMNRRVGIVADILKILADENVSFEHMPSSIDSISVIMRDENFTPEVERRVISRIRGELDINDVEVYRGLALVMLVGEAMADTVGVTARAVTALSRANVGLEMIIQDHSEMSVIFIVDSKFCNYAIETLYHEFFTRNFSPEIR